MITKVISGNFLSVFTNNISSLYLEAFQAVVGYPLTFYVILTFEPIHDILIIGQIKIYV